MDVSAGYYSTRISLLTIETLNLLEHKDEISIFIFGGVTLSIAYRKKLDAHISNNRSHDP